MYRKLLALSFVFVLASVAASQTTVSRVFVTSATYSGNLGGLAGADAKCQFLADSAGLGGTWKAWLSTSTVTAASRIGHATGPYKRIDRVIVANDWNGLVSGTLLQPIKVTQSGFTFNTTESVWTGTASDGTGTGGCANFTSIGSGQTQPLVGITDSTTSQWTQAGNASCSSNTHHLYCFQDLMPATASISGRVTDGAAGGRGVTRARVVLTGAGLPGPVTIYTDRQGRYSFNGLETGITYTLEVFHGRFPVIRATDSNTLQLLADVTNAHFIAGGFDRPDGQP